MSMTREQAEAALKAMGVAEPSKEAIDAFLNTINGEVKREKDRADRLKEEADKVSDLQKRLDEISNQNLTDIEKAQKETKAANDRVATLEAELKKITSKSELAKAGVSGDAIDKFFNESGEVDYTVLSQIISNARATGASEKEAEIAGKATNPGGGTQTGGGQNEKTEAEKVAEVIGKSLGDTSKQSAEILSHYIQ